MTITLIGMPAVGKSYMGKSIAKKFNMKLVDGDKVIVPSTRWLPSIPTPTPPATPISWSWRS